MAAIPGHFPISLRAWPSKDEKAVALPSLISRINSERGSFRSVTEEELEEELKKVELGLDTNKEDGASKDEDVDGEEPDRLKEISIAREQILGQLEQAHNASMVALDFISLLLSKDTPVQASLSLSPALRESVALGTLGSDRVQDSNITRSQKQENRRISRGWKVQSLSESVDSVLASATRLEKEIEKETKYWEQILAVSEKGWAICRLPQEKHTLGVRFGFAESTPAFYSRSLGALRRNSDGAISLDQGIVESSPKRVRIRIQADGITTGNSSPPDILQNPTSIESLILAARNTIFAEELWQELNREARVLTNQGVRVIGQEIACPMTLTKRILIDLQPVETDEATLEAAENKNDNTAAEMISLSLHLLLSHAHRQNLRRRSQPPPPITNRPNSNQPYYLLRPILALLHHESIISSLTNTLSPLSKALISAGVSDASYTITTVSLVPNLTSPPNNVKTQSAPDKAIETLLSNMFAEFTLPLTRSLDPSRSQSLSIRLRTVLFPTLGTSFMITAEGGISKTCKPPLNPSSLDEVKHYISWAAACAIALSFTENIEDERLDKTGQDETIKGNSNGRTEGGKLSAGRDGWHITHNPTILRMPFENEADSKELSFHAIVNGDKSPRAEIRATFKQILSGAKDPQQLVRKEKTKANEMVRRIWTSEDGIDSNSEDGNKNGENATMSKFVEQIEKWTRPLEEDGEVQDSG